MKRVLVLNSLFYTGVVLSHPGFFVFNPFAPGFTILGLLQTLSSAGWILTICLPLISWIVQSIGASRMLLLASVLLWPLSLLLIRVFMALVTGDPGFQYLVNYPIFAVTDFIAPALLSWWILAEERRLPATAKGALGSRY